MVFNKEDKVLIKSLCELKGYNGYQFMVQFSNEGRKKCSTNRLLQKLRNNGTVDSDLKQRLIDAWANVS